jgi:DNA-binding beta-propeller fold protein YncE
MPRHLRVAVLVPLVVAVAVALAVPALGSDPGLEPLGSWGTGDEVGPHIESIAAAADGSIVVADRKRDRVVRFEYTRAHAGSFSATDPRGIAVVPGGYLVSEPEQVRRTDAAGTTLATYPARDPYGVALAGDTVLIADAAHGRILRYRLDGTALPAWDAKLEAPRGLAIGPHGTVYVADAGEWRIETFDAGGEHTGGWRVPDPHGVAVAADGTVYVATHHFGKLALFTSAGEPAGFIGRFTKPRAVAVDCRGTVTVADNSTHRLAAFGDPEAEPPPCVKPPPPPPPPRPVVVPPPPPPPPPPPEQPVLGTTAALVPVSGSVFVGDERRELKARRIVPVETLIDATDGQVELTFETFEEDADKYGPYQHGVFQDGAFTIHQGRNDSLVELRLVGEDAEAAAAGPARTAARRKRRRVWGSATGEFRTVGRHGAATVRGTRWLTEERPAGTFFRVTEGVVLAEAFQRDQRRLLHAGESFLARPACVSRRNFRIRVRVPLGTTVRSARVTVAGKRVRVSYADRITAPVDLRGLPRGTVKVQIRLVTTRGTVLTGTRTYRTCAAPRSSDSLPEL